MYEAPSAGDCHKQSNDSGSSSESGLTMVMFALWMVVLFGFAAFALDTSRIYNEHSELQNGADAAALAIAADCAQELCSGFYDEEAVAEMYSDANLGDGTSSVDDVDLDLLNREVTVEVVTEDDAGEKDLDMVLAQIVGFEDAVVKASATVRWGPPVGMEALPLVFSKCEWDAFGNEAFVDEDPLGFLHRASSVVDGDLPPTLGYPYVARYVTIYFHGDSSPCGGSPSGQDIPGGFGWMDPEQASCMVKAEKGQWREIDPGVSPPSECNPSGLRDLVGTVQYIPFFNDSTGTGTNAQHHVDGLGALYVTGYNFGGQFKEDSIITGLPVCTGSDRCIQGYMVGGWADSSVSTGTNGSDYGVVAIELVD